MKNKVILRIALRIALITTICLVLAFSQSSASNSSDFAYPVKNYKVVAGGGEFGFLRGEDIYHLGVDVYKSAGDNVYATADGIVKHVGIHTRFGTVILIEHTLNGGEKVVSLYGHLNNNAEVSEGQKVKKGQLIGHIGAEGEENGYWSEHLHFGIRKGAYVPTSQGWVYWGMGNKEELKNWYDPAIFFSNAVTQKIDKDNKAKILTVPGIGGRTRTKLFNKYGEEIENSDIVASDYDFRGGGDVAFGNVTGNKNHEIIVGAGQGSEPTVRIYDKNSKRLIKEFLAFEQSFRGGVRVASGDLNNDGKDEIIVGAGPGGGPHIRVFSGNGKVIHSKIFPFGDHLRTGVDVATGDVDGDKNDEIIASLGPGSVPQVKIIESNGKLKNYFHAYDDGFRGGVRIACGDVDRDGTDEIITGAGAGGGPHVRVFESDGRGLAGHFFPFHPDFRGGVDVGSFDFNGDGQDEILTSQNSNGQAWVKVYEYNAEKTIHAYYNAYYEGFEGGASVAGLR